jgi:anthranilate/para-aminobenzoate synthase component I
LLTPNNSPELQWSQFIASANNCLLETSSGDKSLIAQNPIGIFSSFKELFIYLEKNPDLLDIDDLGLVALKDYRGREYIQLYCEILEIDKPKFEQQKALKAKIEYPDKESYIDAVRKCQEYIYEGDIYQANLCHEFKVLLEEDYNLEEIKSKIYTRLRELNPANYMAIADFDDWLVFSSSPESFLRIRFDNGFKLESSPIKGTAGLNDKLEDLKNEKESAEHIMIVDLIRNDLGRIAKTGSVKVKKLLEDTKHSNLQHLESIVEAKLKETLEFEINGITIPDFEKVFGAISPGGSITGAPKIRSMQIINELEHEDRGLFTGNLGFYKFKEKRGEFNILIRSIFYNKKNQELCFNTGAGITSSSDPEKEFDETLLKAEKLIEVFDAV